VICNKNRFCFDRICKYPLLLRELIKHTPPENADKKKLENAFEKINSVVLEVNESQRAHENRKKIMDLQSRLEGVELFGQLVSPSRVYIKEGCLQVGIFIHTHLLLSHQNETEKKKKKNYSFEIGNQQRSGIRTLLPLQ